MKQVLFWVLLVVSFSVSAVDCEDKASSAGMNGFRDCIFTESEKPVNDTYSKLIKALSDKKESLDLLKTSQVDWIKFRDSTCNYASSFIGGGMGLDEKVACQTDFNAARVKILKKYLKDAKAVK